MTEWHYKYAGVSVTSTLELPEWASFSTALTSPQADVLIRQTNAMVEPINRSLLADETSLCFTLPQIGRYRIHNGQEIVLTPSVGAESRLLRLALLGAAWGALGYQRGWLPLHASVVQLGDGAVAFCAPTRHGKSSLAAWLTQQGYELISDDLCRLDVTIDRAPRVWRSAPRLKLWQEALTALAWQTPILCRDQLRIDKFHLAAPETQPGPQRSRVTWPLRAIYLLQWGELGLEPLTGLDAVSSLISAATYRPEFVTAMGQSAAYWQQAIALVNHIPVFQLCRPRDWAMMPTVGELLLDHLRRNNFLE